MAEELKIDFGDGVSALDRTMRTITMIADGAIGHLLSLGWRRGSVNLEIGEDPLPCWVTLRKRRVFEIKLVKHEDTNIIVIEGEWLEKVEKPGIIDRFMGH